MSRGKEARMAPSIMALLQELPDPRGRRGRRHRLDEIMVIAILAVICGAEGWTDMEEFGQSKEEWLRSVLDLKHGIPSHDTFGDVFAVLDPGAFETCFRRWTEAIAGEIEGVVTLDGKTLRRSFDRASKKAAIHMISAWASDNGVVFGQLATNEKGNEITAIPQLLRMLALKGLIVTIDAMGCQKAIAGQIIEQGAEYVLQVKGNQPELLEDVERAFRWAERRGFAAIRHAVSEVTEKGHGRIETRRATVMWMLDLVRSRDDWPGLRCLIRVECMRVIGQERTMRRHFYISSVQTRRSEELARLCRQHWSIENQLHWSLDVSFGEDGSRVRKGNAAQNLSRLRRLALNLLKRENTRRIGIKAKRLRAGWDHDYLIKVLRG